MRVLTFGWEFPPHISGGLGTASYGLTKALKQLGVDIIFVVPRLFGDEDAQVARLIGANQIPVRVLRQVHTKHLEHFSLYDLSEPLPLTLEEEMTVDQQKIWEQIQKIIVNSPLVPYANAETFEEYLKMQGISPEQITVTGKKMLVYRQEGEYRTVEVSSESVESLYQQVKFDFSGGYGQNLFQEVLNYAIVAREIARQQQFDIIHSHDWLTYLAGVEAKRVSGKPLVVHVHATEFDRSGENINQAVYDIERFGMHNADLVITVSNWTRNIVINRYGVPPGKVYTVYNAVDHLPDYKRHYRKTVPEKIVTFLGRITFQKGPEYFVEAAKLVYDRCKDVRFVMAGSGDMYWRMIRLAASRRITDRFHFTGFLRGEDVIRMLDISDVYVMPSVSEPFGISPLEAMRFNVPVIISKQSGVAEVLNHAIKVDFWDTHAIADSIYGLVKYRGLAEIFRKYARQELEQLKWENSARKVVHLYELVLSSKVLNH